MAHQGLGLEELRTVADYQFGRDVGAALFPPSEQPDVERSRSGRPRQITTPDGRIATFLTDGRLSVGIEGGRRIRGATDPPTYRVVVGEESEPFVRDGRNAFAKFVLEADPAVRPGDEVLVVSEGDELLGVGRAELAAGAMADFASGMAVMVREGAD